MARRRELSRRRLLLAGGAAVLAVGGGWYWLSGRRTLDDLLTELCALVSFGADAASRPADVRARELRQGLERLFYPEAVIEIERFEGLSVRADAVIGDLLTLQSSVSSLTLRPERVVKAPQVRIRSPHLPKDAELGTTRVTGAIGRLDGSSETRTVELDVAARGRPLKLILLRARESESQ